MKSKGLGTGLGALFGDAAIDEKPNDFEYLPLQRIEPRPEQPRSVFEQEKIDELAASIREHGVLQPLSVRSAGDGYYQIIAGERRWRAARAAGLAEVPVRIITADDRKATELALVENLQREDLSPVEEARGYKTLMDESGMTQEEVAQRLGKSRPAIANALRLLALPDELLVLVGSGKLSAGSARTLLPLKNHEQMISAARTVIDNDLSVRDVESLVKKLSREKPERSRDNIKGVDYLVDVRKALETALGRRVTIKHGNKDKGKIELEYYSQDDLDALFDVKNPVWRPER
jgi:ParB family chromosome partitioning protein